MPIIEVDNVSKSYPARQGARALLGRGGIASWFGAGARPYEALRNINLSIEAGHSLGIIGRNGSGKSTLLKMLAGVTLPTTGRITVQGRVASLLELGAGFHPMLTGRENIYLNAGLLGMRHKEVDKVFDSIVEFSGIAPFIDQPVDTYSSGMYVRIAFAVAVHVNPDIFLVDEVLSVGDEEFQRKCRLKIGELKEQGKTIVFVSHDLGSVSALCDRVVLLSNGEMISRETPQQTIEYYLRQIGQAGGIHAMRGQDTEALFNHGAISLYSGGHELTAGMGMRLQLHSQGHVQDSHDAPWTVQSREETFCEAECALPRLPIVLKYRLELDGTRLRWQIRMVCKDAASVDRFVVLVPAPDAFAEWTYDGERGRFPDLTPADLVHTVVVPPAPGCLEACLLPGDGEAHIPALQVALRAPGPGWTVHLANSDYATGARVVTLHRQVPKSEQPLPTGEHDVLEVDIELVPVAEALAAHERTLAARTIPAGTVTAQIGRGSVTLAQAGRLLTKGLHVHTQLQLSGVWLMS
ncbi:MAG: ABC transporter ATP-binding protein, partial [Candidatus Hydrogenedentes bacterium]|nr:ABC transporter ATP-binding protein [Candidatus Hydrogenedentota bacterium]